MVGAELRTVLALGVRERQLKESLSRNSGIQRLEGDQSTKYLKRRSLYSSLTRRR